MITISGKNKSVNVKIIDETDLGLGNINTCDIEIVVDRGSLFKRGFVPKEWVEKYSWKKIKKFFKYLAKNLYY